jgi:hypothetical protein
MREKRCPFTSPYLFFWQAGEEVEDEKEDREAKPLIQAPQQAPRQMARMQLDTLVGMGFPNIIALFIMLKTAATLHAHGVTDIQTSLGSGNQGENAFSSRSPRHTSSQAAEALRPIAGRFVICASTLNLRRIAASSSLTQRAPSVALLPAGAPNVYRLMKRLPAPRAIVRRRGTVSRDPWRGSLDAARSTEEPEIF